MSHELIQEAMDGKDEFSRPDQLDKGRDSKFTPQVAELIKILRKKFNQNDDRRSFEIE
ncbi:MAG: hypothetical protein WC884_01230 [Candidatus Paceibacterota bacterium]